MNPHDFDDKYLHQLPKWCLNLETKIWFIDCWENDFPKTLIQVLKLGLSFIPAPSERELHFKIFLNYPELRDKISITNSRLASIISKCKIFVKGRYLLRETDKNMGPSIISIRKYEELSLNLLTDITTFSQLQWYEKDIVKHYIMDLKKIQVQDIENVITPTKREEVLPRFAGLPKVHKPVFALRPVVNASACITTKLSQFLQVVLVERLRYFDKINTLNMHSTDQFVELLQKIEEHTDIKHIDALDIKSLYTNIPHWLIFESVKFSFDAFPFDGEYYVNKKTIRVVKNDILDMIRLYLKYNMLIYITENHSLVFKQTKGIPTGGNVSPTLAMLSLSYLEIQFRDIYPLKFDSLRFSARYLDDVIILSTAVDYDASLVSRLIYQDIFILERTEVNKSQKPFLDLEISKDSGVIHWKLFRKPNNAYCYPHFKSYMPMHIKTGFIHAEIQRIKRRCKSPDEAEWEINFFKERLFLRGYNERFIKKAETKSSKRKDKIRETSKWRVIPYIEGCSNNELLKILKIDRAEYSISTSMHKSLIKYFN